MTLTSARAGRRPRPRAAAQMRPSAAAVHADIVVAAPAWTRTPRLRPVIRAAVAAAAVAARRGGEVAVLLTDDAALRTLNHDWRGIDKPTNVLSFPAASNGAPDGSQPLGDIALAYETVAREAREQDKPLQDHLAHLVVHGLLHLIGHDHETDAEADAMEALEVAILARLDIPNPYLARDTGTNC